MHRPTAKANQLSPSMVNRDRGSWGNNPPNWPTLRHEGFDAGGHRGTPDSLHAAVKHFPTPSANDNRDRGHANMPAIQRRIEKGKQVMLSMHVQQEKGQKLHGRWTLALMGFPPDWCDDLPPDPLGTTPT